MRVVLFILALSGVFIPGVLAGQEVNVRARVDSTNYLIGDPILVHLDATHPKGASLKVAVGDTTEGFTILTRSPFVPSGETASSATLSIAKYDSGVAVLPPLEILYTLPGDTSLHHTTTNPLLLTVRTVAVDTSQAFKDVKPPLSIPITLAELALYVGIVVLVCALIFLGYKYWKRRQRTATGEVCVPPPRPAHIIALEELAKLKEQRLWQQGRIKEYYSGVSEIIRRYIENRFKLMALEQTTDEIMVGLKRLHIAQPVTGKIETLLQLSDLVKFAKYQPGLSEHEGMLGIAFEVVESTKQAAPPSALPVQQQSVANVES